MEELPGVIGYEERGCGGGPCPLRACHSPDTPVYSPTVKISKTLLLEVLWRFHDRDMVD